MTGMHLSTTSEHPRLTKAAKPRYRMPRSFGIALVGMIVAATSHSATHAQCSLTFAPAVNYSVHPDPWCVAVVDFNHDGSSDLVSTGTVFSDVFGMRNNGAGAFPSVTFWSAGLTSQFYYAVPVSVTAGDFNSDGYPDLAIADENSAVITVLLGDSGGSFSAPNYYNTGQTPESIAIGDFDGDGKSDLAVATVSGVVSILLGNGNGTFRPATPRDYSLGPYGPVGEGLRSVVAGDFNHDGKADLAVANYANGSVSILNGNGDGTFTRGIDSLVDGDPYCVVAGDFNGDGITDLVTANNVGHTVSVLLGNGDGSFRAAAPTRDYNVDGNTISVAVGDFNMDGRQDLAVANYGAFGSNSRVSILLGNGDGTFQPRIDFAVAPSGVPSWVAVGDFNGDGLPDFATANRNTSNVSVLLNTTQIAATILRHPTSRETCPTGTAMFSVTGVGPGPFTYQWQWRPLGATAWLTITDGPNTDPLTGATAFTAASSTQPTVTLTNSVGSSTVVTGGRREFQVVVSNACGSATSATAVWATCPADFNCSGQLEVADIFAFLNAWFAGRPTADFDGLNGLQVADIFAFLNAWFSGC